MLAVAHPFLRRLAKPLAIAVGVLSLVFLLQVATHSHVNSQEELTCCLCQAVHVAPAVSVLVLSASLVFYGEVTAPVAISISECFSEHSPARAPPSL
ncbi:MAG TPA: hypothetical protein VGF61_09105 [Candidatus Acidoferrum sp.]|jgi:hypothetical protein